MIYYAYICLSSVGLNLSQLIMLKCIWMVANKIFITSNHSLGHQNAIIHRIIHLTNNDFTNLNLENLGLLPSAINSIFRTDCVQATFLYQLCRSAGTWVTLSMPTLSTSFSSFKISSSTARSPDRLTASGFFTAKMEDFKISMAQI